jgi:putative addiction module CopG family antidote
MIEGRALMAGGRLMDVSLTPALAQFVQDTVAAGTYSSVDALVQEALELLRLRDEQLRSSRDELDALIAEGLSDVQAGRWLSAEDAMAELQAANDAQKRQSA